MNDTIWTETDLPSFDEMYFALCARDSQYEGVFFVGVRTTGIFCRPTCSARKPKRENVEFHGNASAALAAGFRPCKRCRPLEVFGEAPTWINELLAEIESDTSRRWTDANLRERGIQPEKLRRWFKTQHGMTFQAYLRSRRLSGALGQLSIGKPVTNAALDNGYQSLSGFREAFRNWCGELPAAAKSDVSPLVVNRILSPLGPMVVVASDEGIWLLEFADRRMLETQFKRLVRWSQRTLVTGNHDMVIRLATQLEEYFAGQRRAFDVPLKILGTDFQVAVWNQLVKIPHGETTSYECLAKRIGRSGAQRAVGRANGDNRLAILVPCHRVIRGDGALSGYAGGLWRKRRLLDIEQRREP